MDQALNCLDETAIQHWKDRCFASEQRLTQLRELLEHIPQFTKNDLEMRLAPLIAELLVTIQKLINIEDETQTSLPVPSPRLHSLELPDFLARCRLYRTR